MANKRYEFSGYGLSSRNGRLTIERQHVVPTTGDYGQDPICDVDGNPTGRVRLVPSGREVTSDEARQILVGVVEGGEVDWRISLHTKEGEQ